MSSILEQQVTIFLTTVLGRAPTVEEIRLGMISPYPLSPIHNSLTVGQSILAVEVGESIQDAIDKISLNGGGIVFLKGGTYDNSTSHIILYSNVRLVGVGSDGSIIDFGGNAFQIQIMGVVMSVIDSAFLQGITVQNSSIELIKASYTNNLGGSDVKCLNGLIGTSIDNSTILNWDINTIDSCGTGIFMDTVSGFTINNAFISNITTVGAYVVQNSSNGVLINSSLDIVTGVGFSFTNSSNIGIDQISVTNVDGIGILLDSISGSFSVTNGLVDGSSGDALLIQNTCIDIVVATMQFSNNVGWGVNISDIGSTDNLFLGNTFKNNTAGNLQDLGTGTLIRSNIGVADN